MATLIGLELKIARLRAGLKQYEMAARLGISSTQLCEIEMGRKAPSPELANEMARIINESISTKEAKQP